MPKRRSGIEFTISFPTNPETPYKEWLRQVDLIEEIFNSTVQFVNNTHPNMTIEIRKKRIRVEPESEVVLIHNADGLPEPIVID